MSQLLEEGLFSVVTGDTAVHAIIATRMYPRRLPDQALLPALTYSVVSGQREGVQAGDAGLPRVRIQLNCHANDYLTAKTLAKAVTNKLSGFRGAAGTSGTIACDVEYGPDGFDDVARRDFIAVDVLVWHQEGN